MASFLHMSNTYEFVQKEGRSKSDDYYHECDSEYVLGYGKDKNNAEDDYDTDDDCQSLESFDEEKRFLRSDPSSTSLATSGSFIVFNLPPPAATPGGPRIVNSISPPCSSSSSPQPDIVRMEGSNKWGHQDDNRPQPLAKSPLHRQQSEAISRFADSPDTHLPRSKSCGDGRSSAPPDEFDICLKRESIFNDKIEVDGIGKDEQRTGARPDDSDHNTEDHHKVKRMKEPEEGDRDKIVEKEFKCGSFCISIPTGLCKRKHVTPQGNKTSVVDGNIAVSRVASLEKFEYSAWTSVPMAREEEEEEHVNSYFDLPVELIKNEENDTDSPVKAAFVFESERKGVLKSNSTTKPSVLRHVRFSTPTFVSVPSSPIKADNSTKVRNEEKDINEYLVAHL